MSLKYGYSVSRRYFRYPELALTLQPLSTMEKQTVLHTSPSYSSTSEELHAASPVKVQEQFRENWREDRRENLRELSQELRASAGKIAENVENRMKNAYSRSRTWAQENPRTAITVATVGGLAVLGGVFAWWYTSRRARTQAEPPTPTQSGSIPSIGQSKRSA